MNSNKQFLNGNKNNTTKIKKKKEYTLKNDKNIKKEKVRSKKIEINSSKWYHNTEKGRKAISYLDSIFHM